MQITRSYAPPKSTQFPIEITASDINGVQSLEVDNGSALTLTITADGQIIRTVAPYVARVCLNTGGSWRDIVVTANDAIIQATDSLTVIAYDTQIAPPLLPAYGPSAWGGGAVPNTLVNLNAGDQILAWQVQQLINLLTGVMTLQPVTINNPVVINSGGLDLIANAIKGIQQIIAGDPQGIAQDWVQLFGGNHPNGAHVAAGSVGGADVDLRFWPQADGYIDLYRSPGPIATGHVTDTGTQLPLKVGGVVYWLELRS